MTGHSARLMMMGFLAAPALASAQEPWTVAITSSMNPLPVGACAAVQLTLLDRSSGDVPRNPLGQRVTIADFDVTVTSPDGTSAAAHQIDAYHVSACGCQRATPGTAATITATYPAQNLAAGARVPGVAFRKMATFTLAAPKGDVNPPACTLLASAPVPQMPRSSVAVEPSAPRVTAPASAPATTPPARAAPGIEPTQPAPVVTAPPTLLPTQKGTTQTLELAGAPTVRNITTQTLDLTGTRVIRNITTQTLDLAGTRVVRNITTATLSLTIERPTRLPLKE